MARRPYISPEHVIWAYENTIRDMMREGMTATAIQRALRDECSLRVGREAIQAVMATWQRGLAS